MSRTRKGRSLESTAASVAVVGPGFGSGIVEAAVLLAVVSVPLYFNPTTERVFEPDKLAIVTLLAAMCLTGLVWRILVEGWRPRTLPGRPMVFAAALALAATAAGAILAPDQTVGLFGSYRRGMGLVTHASFAVLFAGSVIVLRRDVARWRLVRAITVGLIPLAAYAVLQRFGVDSIAWEERGPSPADRAFAAMGNPIFLGAYLVVALPFVAAGLARWGSPSRTRRIAYGFALVLGLCALAATASRGPVIGLLGGAGAAAVLVLAATGRRRLAAALLTAGALTAGAGIVAAGKDHTVPVLGPALWSSRTATERILLWELVQERAAAEPRYAAFGAGPDGLDRALNPYLTDALVALTPDQTYDRAHNVVLEWGVSGGVLAVLAMGFLFAAAFAAGLRRLGASIPRAAPLGIVGAAGLAGWGAAAVHPAMGPLGAVATGVIAALALAVRGLGAGPSGSAPWRASGGTLLAVAALAALAGHLAEGSFGLPTAPTAVLVWIVLGLVATLGSPQTSSEIAAGAPDHLSAANRRGATPAPPASRYAVAAEGIVDGVVLSTVAFSPLLLPSPLSTADAPLMLLLLPLAWVAGDALGEATSDSPWIRPGLRLLVILGFASLFSMHPMLHPGGQAVAYAAMLVVATLALGAVLGRVPVDPTTAPEPARATPPLDLARATVAASLAVVLVAGAWHLAIRPVRADALVLSSLEAGAGGDLVKAVGDAEEAVRLWPEQPALSGYLASAHRAVMLDAAIAPDVRDAAYERAAAVLENAFHRSPAAGTAARMAELHRDRGDAAPAGGGRESSWEEAIEWYERSLALQPVAPVVLTAYGQTLERLGVWDGAATIYTRALSVDPARHEARAGLVRGLLATLDVPSALDAVEAGRAIDPSGLAAELEGALSLPVPPLLVTQSRVLFLIAANEVESDPGLFEALRRAKSDDEVSRALLELAAEGKSNPVP